MIALGNGDMMYQMLGQPQIIFNPIGIQLLIQYNNKLDYKDMQKQEDGIIQGC